MILHQTNQLDQDTPFQPELLSHAFLRQKLHASFDFYVFALSYFHGKQLLEPLPFAITACFEELPPCFIFPLAEFDPDGFPPCFIFPLEEFDPDGFPPCFISPLAECDLEGFLRLEDLLSAFKLILLNFRKSVTESTLISKL